MPAIPLYQQQINVGGGFNAPRADASETGGQIGAALGRIGQGLGEVAQAEQLNQRVDAHLMKVQQEKDAQSWSGVAVSNAQLEWAKNLQDRKANALPGAPDFTPSVLTEFDDYAKKTADAAPTPLARDFVRQHMQQLRTNLGQQAIAFEGAARVSLRTDNALSTIDNAAKLVQQDPYQYGTQLNLIRQTLPAVGPEAQAKLNEHAIKSLTNAAASNIMDANPYAVREATGKALGVDGFTGKTGVAWIDDATPDQVKQWNNQAQTKIAQIENAKARDAQAAEAAALKTLNGAVEMADKGQYFSQEFTAQLQRDAAGTSYEKQAQALIDNQAQTVGFASMPATQRAALLERDRALAVTPGKGLDPTESKDLARRERIDSAIAAAYKENPWQAAQQYGAIQRAPMAAITTPADALQVISNRAPFAAAVESHAGHAISLLQPQEAEAFGRVLRTLPPDQAAAALSQIGTTVGSPDRIAALAKQLGANNEVHELMMLSAGDKTNAGRTTAELISRGALALADKTIKKDDAALSGWKSTIAPLVNGTLGNPQAEDQIKRAAYYVRAAMEDGDAKAPGFSWIGDSDSASAIAMVAGWPVDRSGVKTLLPRGMKPAEFDEVLSKFKANDLAALSPTGKLYLGSKEISPVQLANDLSVIGLQRWNATTYVPLRNGRPVTLDPAGATPLKLRVQ